MSESAEKEMPQLGTPSSSSAEERVEETLREADDVFPAVTIDFNLGEYQVWVGSAVVGYGTDPCQARTNAASYLKDVATLLLPDSRVPTGGEPEPENDHGAALLPADPSAAVTTEPLPSMGRDTERVPCPRCPACDKPTTTSQLLIDGVCYRCMNEGGD